MAVAYSMKVKKDGLATGRDNAGGGCKSSDGDISDNISFNDDNFNDDGC